MANKINISIPQPCHENWEGMTAVKKGKFCDSCQKKVFDFTNASDREIVNAFQQNENLCGRFLNTQLNRDLVRPKQKSSFWLATTTSLISLVGITETTAQEPVKTEQSSKKYLKKKAGKIGELVSVSGKVQAENGTPLANIGISIKGVKIARTTADGKFTVIAGIGDQLDFINLNDASDFFESFIVREAANDLVFSQPHIVAIEGFANSKTKVKITTGVISITCSTIETRKRRTFFGRIFYAIGNWFK